MTDQEMRINRNSEDSWDKKLEEDKDELLFEAGRSMRYHDKRARFFDILDKFFTFLSLMFSSAALIALTQSSHTAVSIVAVISSASSALSLVCGFSEKSRNHFDFKKQWYDLYSTIEKTAPSIEDLDRLKSDYQRIEREEPAVMYWLNEICYIEQGIAMGYSKDQLEAKGAVPIPWYYRLTANFHNFYNETK